MPLHSLEYLLFLILSLGFTVLFARRWRWLPLVLLGLVFYAWQEEPRLLAALAATILVTYGAGLLLECLAGGKARSAVFWFSVAILTSILLYMRYLPFLARTVNALLPGVDGSGPWPIPEAIVSVGVSFFVFQAIAYLTDIQLGMLEPERHPGRFALFIGFFPKLLQGPIERGGDLLPQFLQPKQLDYNRFRLALLTMGGGFFKKVVLADRLAFFVDPVFSGVHDHSGIVLLLSVYAYALQIYFDFSGYVDIARGSAMLFGYDLSPNFNSPYLATSIADFWRRWHITFSRWILDYLFKPMQLGMRRWPRAGTTVALLATFLISGIWHGPSWGYVLWGLMHGVLMAGSYLYKPLQKKIHARLHLKKSAALKIWQPLLTFHLVCAAWVLFRAESLSDAWYVWANLFNFNGFKGLEAFLLVRGGWALGVLVGALGLVALLRLCRRLLPGWQSVLEWPWWVRWSFYYAFGFCLVIFGEFTRRSFIYFKF